MNVAEALNAARRPAVLVVEDEILVRTTIAEFLRDQGYFVIEAANATEAVAVFASQVPVNIVFTDWQMPGGMDGLMLARWVGLHHPEVHVLLASGYGNAAEYVPLIARESFFTKPYDFDKVTARIRDVLAVQGHSPP